MLLVRDSFGFRLVSLCWFVLVARVVFCGADEHFTFLRACNSHEDCGSFRGVSCGSAVWVGVVLSRKGFEEDEVVDGSFSGPWGSCLVVFLVGLHDYFTDKVVLIQGD